MEPLFEEWSELLSLLTRHRVRFVLGGGHAIAFHARPRHTEDLDVFVEPSPTNARRLHAALVDFGRHAPGIPAPAPAHYPPGGNAGCCKKVPSSVDAFA